MSFFKKIGKFATTNIRSTIKDVGGAIGSVVGGAVSGVVNPLARSGIIGQAGDAVGRAGGLGSVLGMGTGGGSGIGGVIGTLLKGPESLGTHPSQNVNNKLAFWEQDKTPYPYDSPSFIYNDKRKKWYARWSTWTVFLGVTTSIILIFKPFSKNRRTQKRRR